MTDKLANLMTNFICDTIRGYESGLYKSFVMNNKNMNDILTHKMTFILVNFNVKYFNNAYSSLIRNDDPYIMEKFGEMHDVINHSYICLLNILFKLTTDIITSYDRSIFNVFSYDEYMKSVDIVLETCKKVLLDELPKMISHNCNGIDITTCNPNEPLFYIK
jgi:hypothetical protein